ncbi:MAG: PBP1A family penicillin-binding protein [Caedimonas sp.]|nr:PBP1A family penicillin-binding protein [Caedimonas sp.]
MDCNGDKLSVTDRPPTLRVNPDERLRNSYQAKERAFRTSRSSSGQEPQHAPKRKKSKRGGSNRLILWILNILIWSVVGLGGGVLWYAYDLPDIKRLEGVTRKPGVTLLARDGSMMATYGDLYGSIVEVRDLPSHVPAAIMAIEDRRFYRHFGVDVFGIVRAAWVNYRSGSVVQGGSTLTQQLAKNFLLSEKLYEPSNRSLRRKIQEVLLAFWLERKFSKEQILTIYLNRVYLGAGVYGIDAAAHKYFTKKAKDLNVYEAAIIAGLLKAPSRYSPISNPQLAHERAQTVLAAMEEAGFISHHQRLTYATAPEPLKESRHKALTGRYFSDWIFETLDEYVGKIEEDLIVQTTLDPRLQNLAEEKALTVLHSEGPKLNITQAALVAMTPDGGVRAMVGGKNYIESQFNRVTQARRQIGSSFKFFTFLCALEQGFTPSSMIADTPTHIGKWKPKNYKYTAQGEVSLTDGFAYSVNAVAVRLARHVGLKAMAEMTHRLGLTSPQPKDMTISLGSGQTTLLELTSAYAAVANHGFGVWPYGITEVRTVEGGKVLYKRKSQGAGRVLAPRHVVHMLRLMSAAFSYGTGKAAFIGRPCVGKTGTSQNYRDAWSIGFTPDLVTGVWVGNDNEAHMKMVTGGKIPARIWHDFMSAAHNGYPVHVFPDLQQD